MHKRAFAFRGQSMSAPQDAPKVKDTGPCAYGKHHPAFPLEGCGQPPRALIHGPAGGPYGHAYFPPAPPKPDHEAQVKSAIQRVRDQDEGEQIARTPWGRGIEARLAALEQPSYDRERVKDKDVAARSPEADIRRHRAVGSEEHDPARSLLHGFCAVCVTPWPCAIELLQAGHETHAITAARYVRDRELSLRLDAEAEVAALRARIEAVRTLAKTWRVRIPISAPDSVTDRLELVHKAFDTAADEVDAALGEPRT